MIGAPAAAAVVAALAAAAVALAAIFAPGKPERAPVEVVESVASPIATLAPLGLVATAFREFLCGAPASLSGSVTGDWQGGEGLQFSFDWELTL